MALRSGKNKFAQKELINGLPAKSWLCYQILCECVPVREHLIFWIWWRSFPDESKVLLKKSYKAIRFLLDEIFMRLLWWDST